jgi:hypothetical protein
MGAVIMPGCEAEIPLGKVRAVDNGLRTTDREYQLEQQPDKEVFFTGHAHTLT